MNCHTVICCITTVSTFICCSSCTIQQHSAAQPEHYSLAHRQRESLSCPVLSCRRVPMIQRQSSPHAPLQLLQSFHNPNAVASDAKCRCGPLSGLQCGVAPHWFLSSLCIDSGPVAWSHRLHACRRIDKRNCPVRDALGKDRSLSLFPIPGHTAKTRRPRCKSEITVSPTRAWNLYHLPSDFR